MIDMHLKIIII